MDGPAVLSSGVDEVTAAIDAEGLTLRRFVWSPKGDALYFEGSSESVRNIWRVPVDARSLTWKSAPERLTTSATSETEIAVSPDGRRLAFRAHAERTRLWSFPLEAGGLRAAAGEPLTSGEGRELQPDAPTAGNKLLYQTVRGAHRELREISLIDRREHVLLAGTERIDRALWSPDGTRLAYLRRLDDLGAAPAEFVVLRPSGGVEARYALSRDATTTFRPSDWSPDGTWILGGCRPDGSARLAVCSLDVGEPSPAVAVITAHPDLNLFQQRLSPDAAWITFMAANPLEAGTSTIHVVRAGGGVWTPMTDGRQFDDKPIWSADGRRLYYLSNRGGFFNVWGRRFDPAAGQPVGSPFRVTDFHSPRLMISPDNIPSVGIAVAAEQLVLPITEASGQLWVLDLPVP
jgi:Tol biopolymer transport system component